jgi:micrococcal nuclease
MKKRNSTSRRIKIAGIAGSISVAAAFFIFNYTSYTVLRVIDGDTFETTEKQIIRLNGINAPEKGMCGFETSTKALEKLIDGKRVFLKAVYRDGYKRMISNVYTMNGIYVNEKLAHDGQAIVLQKSKSDRRLIDASRFATSHKSGLHGEPCTEETNKKEPLCNIKGNIHAANETHIYVLPNCKPYKNTIIQKHLGDQWFCTEQEAINAGFRKASDCPSQ